jgi:hypothetical protein
MSLPPLLLDLHAQAIVPTFFVSNIYSGLGIPETLNLTRLQSYEMFEVLLIIRINKYVGLQGILNFHLLRDVFPYQFARGIPVKVGLLYPLQCKVRTPPPHPH